MPSSYLFGVNNEGRVHHLSTGGNVWRELPYVGHDFKKISAVPHFLWALGSDHQIYLYVYGFDIPIKVKEEAYENEVCIWVLYIQNDTDIEKHVEQDKARLKRCLKTIFENYSICNVYAFSLYKNILQSGLKVE